MVGFIAQSLVALGLLGSAAVPVASARTPEPEAEAAEQQFAVVRLTIEQDDGEILRATQTVSWGDAASFDLSAGSHVHRVSILARSPGQVEIDYVRDGGVLLEDASVATGGRRSTIVHRDEAATLAVRVIRTTARVESHPI